MRHAVFFLLLAACGGSPAPADGGGEPPTLLEVLAPTPALEGSILVVRGLGLDALGEDPRLELSDASGVVDALPPVIDAEPGQRLFQLTSAAVLRLGDGTHALTAAARGNGLRSTELQITIRIASSLAVELATGPSGEVHRNEVAVLGGAGFIAATEGTLTARFAGTFSADAGGSTAIDVALPVALLERADRSRGVVVLTTDLGGLHPGTFDGTIVLESSLVSGGASTSSPLAARLHFNAPDLYALEPAVASLGRIVTVRGAGLLGGRDRPSETTILRIAGTFSPEAGAGEPFGPEELVPEWISGEEVRFVVEPEVRGGALVSALFGHARGTFTGTATPVAIDGTDELEGDAVPFQLTLGPLRQVVHVRFLPGFYTALSRFGLASAAEEIEQQVLMRIQGIYSGWGVDVRLEEPTDYGRSSYSVLEIGGADPNGSGLFGYDNTPGKDVGNVRLFDAIGGANAQTQLDGYPGYGGVFVESVLYWSSHPELPGARPASAPDPEPLFDQVFDPVRARAATLAEARGEGDATRVAQVARAIRALASIIGETAAHELGHSLGMAQPFGPPTVYHNDFDGDGCLMDTGGDRPLGERMQEPGFTATHLCYDHPSYLDMILPR